LITAPKALRRKNSGEEQNSFTTDDESERLRIFQLPNQRLENEEAT
jgi:hypothetical protein